MIGYLKSVLLITACVALGAGIGKWFTFMASLTSGSWLGFAVAMAPVVILAAIPFRKVFDAKRGPVAGKECK